MYITLRCLSTDQNIIIGDVYCLLLEQELYNKIVHMSYNLKKGFNLPYFFLNSGIKIEKKIDFI